MKRPRTKKTVLAAKPPEEDHTWYIYHIKKKTGGAYKRRGAMLALRPAGPPNSDSRFLRSTGM